jgi:hypothetical protein
MPIIVLDEPAIERMIVLFIKAAQAKRNFSLRAINCTRSFSFGLVSVFFSFSEHVEVMHVPFEA